jgi:hypothetical protein
VTITESHNVNQQNSSKKKSRVHTDLKPMVLVSAEVGKHSSGITLKLQATVPIAQAQQKYHEVNSIIYVYHSSCLPAFIAMSHVGVHPRVGWEGRCAKLQSPPKQKFLKNQIL